MDTWLNRLLGFIKTIYYSHYFSCWFFNLSYLLIPCLHYYIVSNITQGGYRGFYSKNTINLTPKVVNDIHKRGGTILGTSRGGHDTGKIVDSIQDRGINQVYLMCQLYYNKVSNDDECWDHKFRVLLYQCAWNLSRLLSLHGFSLFGLLLQVYIIGGDGTQRGAAVIYEVGIEILSF